MRFWPTSFSRSASFIILSAIRVCCSQPRGHVRCLISVGGDFDQAVWWIRSGKPQACVYSGVAEHCSSQSLQICHQCKHAGCDLLFLPVCDMHSSATATRLTISALACLQDQAYTNYRLPMKLWTKTVHPVWAGSVAVRLHLSQMHKPRDISLNVVVHHRSCPFQCMRDGAKMGGRQALFNVLCS